MERESLRDVLVSFGAVATEAIRTAGLEAPGASYVRPSRPTPSREEYTWRDNNHLARRITAIRWLMDDPSLVLLLSKQSLRRRDHRQEQADFWGPMILNQDVVGLIEWLASPDLPIHWYYALPVEWPGRATAETLPSRV